MVNKCLLVISVIILHQVRIIRNERDDIMHSIRIKTSCAQFGYGGL